MAVVEEWLPVRVLAARLRTYDRWVHRKVKEFGIKPQTKQFEGIPTSSYPPGTLETLRAEQERIKHWHETNKKQFFTIQELADEIGRSRGWVEKSLGHMKIKPVKYEQRKAFTAALYSKHDLKRIKNLLLPPSEDWLNLGQLAEHTGLDREWIERRLKEAGIKPERRRSDETGHARWFYPPHSLVVLQGAAQLPPGGDYLTGMAIADRSGRSYNWTARRLEREPYSHLVELRLDDQRVPRQHYPPCVLEMIKAEVAALAATPEANGFLPISVIAKHVGRSTLWVRNRLAQMSIKPEMRRDKKDRIVEHYPPEVVPALQQQSSSIAKAGDWLTLGAIAKQFSVPREHLAKALPELELHPDEREMESTHRVELHYSPADVEKLRGWLEAHPYDDLVEAGEAQTRLRHVISSLGYDQAAEALGVTTVKPYLKSSRIRKSTAVKIDEAFLRLQSM